MLECARMENGKCLNTFYFLGVTGASSTPFSSDWYAWRQTEGLPFCHEDSQYPTHDMRWGLATTKGALQFWNLEGDGLGKYTDVLTGSQWWVIARPKGMSRFAETTIYMDNFDPGCPNLHLWDLEAVVLKAGDKLCVGNGFGPCLVLDVLFQALCDQTLLMLSLLLIIPFAMVGTSMPLAPCKIQQLASCMHLLEIHSSPISHTFLPGQFSGEWPYFTTNPSFFMTERV